MFCSPSLSVPNEQVSSRIRLAREGYDWVVILPASERCGMTELSPRAEEERLVRR